MTEYVWSDTYTQAVHAFDGQTPGRDLEASLIERFEQTPESVIAAIEKLASRFQAGKVHSPWPLVTRELDQAIDRNVRVDGKQERAHCVRHAETWIRNAGLHCPNEAEVTHELFEARSNGHQHSSQAWLTPWSADEALHEQMLALWRQLRPAAEQLDADLVERAERWNEMQARLLASDEPTEPLLAPVEDDPWPSRLAYEPDLDLEEALT